MLELFNWQGKYGGIEGFQRSMAEQAAKVFFPAILRILGLSLNFYDLYFVSKH